MSTSGARPEHVDVIGTVLAIRWSDSRESFFDATALRRACPCANCAGEPEGIGPRVRPAMAPLSAQATELLGVEPVGSYALRMIWGDGHSTGIYSFDYLRDFPESV